MASFWGGRGAQPQDDFDEYDPTPYGGGYDIALTFGRPLSPSDEVCHPISSTDGGDVDYDRPHYSYGSITSAYETEADFGDRYGCPHAKPQPAYGFQSLQEEEGGGGYGGDRWPQPPRPEYGDGGGEGEYGSGQGFGYGGREEVEPHYGRRPLEEYGSGFGSGYGDDRPKPHGQEGGQGYGYGSKYGGGDQYWRSEEEGYGGGGGYGRTEEYGYGGKPIYGGDEEGTGRYQKPRYYGEEQGEGYDRPKHGTDSDDEEKKHRHHRHHHHHHRHHRNYDDD